MKLRSLEDLLVGQVKTLRGAEKQIAKGLPKLIGACSPMIGTALESMIEDSKSLRLRLTQVADSLDRKCGLRSCDPVAGLLEEAGSLVVVKHPDPRALDVALIAVAQRLIRYRMVAYAQARIVAENAGNERAAELFRASMLELLKADREVNLLLTGLLRPPLSGSKVTRLVDKAFKRVRPPNATESDDGAPGNSKQPQSVPSDPVVEN